LLGHFGREKAAGGWQKYLLRLKKTVDSEDSFVLVRIPCLPYQRRTNFRRRPKTFQKISDSSSLFRLPPEAHRDVDGAVVVVVEAAVVFVDGENILGCYFLGWSIVSNSASGLIRRLCRPPESATAISGANPTNFEFTATTPAL
jgi:hypothetical protein